MNGVSSFGPWLERLAELSPLVAILAKVTILLVVAWFAHAVLSRANPRWRVLAWRGAAVGLLLIPLFHLVTPPIEFQAPVPTMADGDDKAVADERFESALADPEMPALVLTPTGDEFVTQRPFFSDEAATSQTPSWRAFLLAVWWSGCLCCLFRTTLGARRIRSLVRGSEVAPAGVEAEFARVAHELPVTANAEVRVSARISAPTLCGLFRRTLLIPTRMTEASRAEQLPGVFAHELAHVQSRDLSWNLLLHAISAVLWFHPLAWFARAVHAAGCESVSDAVAAGYLGDVQAYGRTLARVALDAVAPPALTLAMARTSNVQRRVRALERRVFARGLCWQFAGTAFAAGLLVAGALGGFKAVRAEVAVEPRQPVSDQKTKDNEEQRANDSDDGAEKTTNDDQTALVTPEAESAVNKALAFLVARQREDGSFGGDELGHDDPAMTALCGMALLAAGSKPGEGPYGAEVQKVLDYLLDHVHDNGFIGVGPNAGSMYVHAYALRFLAEAQLAHKTARTEKAIAKAVDLIVSSQNARDGWRYSPKSQDADSSVTSCQVIALQVARRAGAEVPQETLERAIKYLNRCQTPDGGYAYVLAAHQSALPRSAAVMTALYLSDVDEKEIEKGLAYLNANATLPNNKSQYYFFTQFHLSTALRYAGEEHFRRWYEPSRDQLLEMQADDGSWHIQHYILEYTTAKACIVLLSPRIPVAGLPEEKQPDDANAND